MKQNQTPFPINDLFEFIESNFVLGQGSLSGQNVKLMPFQKKFLKNVYRSEVTTAGLTEEGQAFD